MLRKYTSLEILSVDSPENTGLQRFATYKDAHRAVFSYDPQPGFLYVRSRAISSRANDNHDAFPAEEIEKAYRTFIGKPVFVNHSNDDHRKARGVIIDAELHKDSNKDGTPDTWVEVLMEVDAVKFPKLAEAVVKGHIDKTSMGVDVAFSICSVCGNKATSPSEYCRHIPQQKGSKLIRRNASTGKPEETLIVETCFGLSFFENSLLVEEPADPSAFVLGVDDRGLKMTASKTGLEAFANQYLVTSPVEDPIHQGMKLGNLERFALGETIAPPDVDTMREDVCPVCFGPDSMVRTEQGYLPIASLLPGDKVLSSDGNFHKILEVMEREYEGLVYHLRSKTMTESIIITPEHPILGMVSSHLGGKNPTSKGKTRCTPGICSKFGENHVVKGGRWGSGTVTHNLDWIFAKNLTEGGWVTANAPKVSTDLDHIDIPVKYLEQKTRAIRNGQSSFELTDDFLWMIGLYLAEGSTGKRTVVFSLHQKEVEYIDRLTKLFTQLGYNSHLYNGYGDSLGCDLEIYSTTLANWFPDWLGSGCENKALPAELLNLPNSKRSIIFRGVLDGDGYKRNNGTIDNTIGQTSSILSIQLAEWAISQGITPSIWINHPENKKTVYITANLDKSTRSHWKLADRQLSEIKDFEPSLYVGKVYNLRVEGDPTYTIQNLLVHNCGSHDSYNGDKCLVCQFEMPPSLFMDPDVELASQVDLRQQQQIDKVQPPPTGPLGDTQTTDDLICPVCETTFTSSEAMNDSGDPHFAPAANNDPAISDLMDPTQNEESNPNTGGIVPDNSKSDNTQDQDVDNIDTNTDDNPILETPDTNESTDPNVDNTTDPNKNKSTDSNSDKKSTDKKTFPPKKKKSSLQRFLSAKDDDFEDKDTDEEPEDTSENSTSNSDDIVGDDETPGDRVDPTNSDQPQQANGDPDGMQQDPSENPVDPNVVNQQDPNNSQQLAQEQFGEDLGAEQQTGYEVGDVCPACGKGTLEENPTANVSDQNDQTIDPQSDADVNPSDDPVTSQNTPKISNKNAYGLNIHESTQSMSKSALPEGEYSMANNPAAIQRAALRTAMNQQAKKLREFNAAGNQERLLRQAGEARIATLEAQILRMAQLMGADEDSVLRDINETGYKRNASIIHQASLIRIADERDPAEPVPEPAAGAPVVTEQEAATPAARADVTQLGATPITDVSADATIAVDQPYGEAAFMPMELNEVDVTQPVAGTQGHLPPEQTIVPVEVRVGDPDDPAPSFPITWGSDGPVVGGSVGTGGANVSRAPNSPPGRQPGTTASKDRTYASLRLAKKRIEAGIAPADAEDILIAASIDSNSDMTDARIRDEIETLSSVIEQRKQSNVRTASRNLVPRSTDPSPAPSFFGGQGPIQSSASLAAVNSDEFWNE